MSDSEQDMPLRLASIETLQGSYKAGVLKAVKSPKYPHKPALLDRVSLWLVTLICSLNWSVTVELVQARRYYDSRD